MRAIEFFVCLSLGIVIEHNDKLLTVQSDDQPIQKSELKRQPAGSDQVFTQLVKESYRVVCKRIMNGDEPVVK